jgi:hypothetical protein
MGPEGPSGRNKKRMTQGHCCLALEFNSGQSVTCAVKEAAALFEAWVVGAHKF